MVWFGILAICYRILVSSNCKFEVPKVRSPEFLVVPGFLLSTAFPRIILRIALSGVPPPCPRGPDLRFNSHFQPENAVFLAIVQRMMIGIDQI